MGVALWLSLDMRALAGLLTFLAGWALASCIGTVVGPVTFTYAWFFIPGASSEVRERLIVPCEGTTSHSARLGSRCRRG